MGRWMTTLGLVAAVLGAGSYQAQAVTVGFDEWTPPLVDQATGAHYPLTADIAEGERYEGLFWTNFLVADGISADALPGFQTGLRSPDFVGFNGSAQPAAFFSDLPFIFEGAYFTAGVVDGLSLTIAGYLAGAPVQSTELTLSVSGPSYGAFAPWGLVDEVRLRVSGPPGAEDLVFAVDDLSYSPVPEPGTLLLVGSGLLGLVGLSRRWRKG